MKKRIGWIVVWVLHGIICWGQSKDTNIFALPIEMDEYVLQASKDGFDVTAFIRRVKEDTTFYKAFKTLHLVPYTASNDIQIFNKKGTVKASLSSRTQQLRTHSCRSMKVLQETHTGDYYNHRKEPNYYTGELYASLFFTNGTVCDENNIVGDHAYERKKGQLEKHKWQLKQLIFNPGSRVAGVPFAGNKVALFEPEVARMYDFKLMLVEYEDKNCYLFSAYPKAAYKDDVIYNELSTWFRTTDYSIVARDYALSYRTLLYDFDVVMKVRLKLVNGQLLPSKISYKGNWHVAMKDRENARFTTVISY